jgi:rSAM/selenodomain-associated transferase 1
MRVIVIAKSPEPGRVKTRLCPPCTHEEAAAIAAAALLDTLEQVDGLAGAEPVLALDGPVGPWVPPDVRILAQRGGGLDERIAAAFEDAGGPALLIGMDTPQLRTPHLAQARERLESGDVDAVLGPAIDGGWWGVGLRTPDPWVFLGVPMSSPHTLESQRARLRSRRLRFDELGPMRDVDTAVDAAIVARSLPGSRFAAAVAASAIGQGAVEGVPA